MQPMRLAFAAALVVVLGASSPGLPVWVGNLMSTASNKVDPKLPDQRLDIWLSTQLPRGVVPRYRTGKCGSPAVGCHILAFDVISRARQLELIFDPESHSFLSGSISGPDIERSLPVTTLSDLSGQLLQPIRPLPLDCPDGTLLKLEEEYAGLSEWCENDAGVKLGPARAWFSTGLYLMYKGSYVAGEKNGRWLECNRFQQCEVGNYQ